MRKVNSDPECPDFEDVSMFRQALPWDENRVSYISNRWDVSRNCARALLLCELSCSASDISGILGVNTGTVSKYINELADKIHVNALMPIKYKYENGYKFDVWSGDSEQTVDYTGDVIDYDAINLPINRGADMKDIDVSLITLPE
jgi:DNA-binding CsgD family transcriptional regulator